MKMDIDYIKKLADVMDEKSIAEISIEENGQKLAIKKNESVINKVVQPVMEAIQETSNVVEQTKTEPPVQNSKLVPITSPMVGTFYNSATPNGTPFVSVGDIIKPGQVVCIIEAMKLMNEIEADVSGRVVEICVENGQTIEFGQVLMYIE